MRGCRDEIVPVASIMTPNQYEAELLVGFPVKSEEDALRACQALHKRGPHTVVRLPNHPLQFQSTWLTIVSSLPLGDL